MVEIVIKSVEADLAFPDTNVFKVNGKPFSGADTPTVNNGTTIDVSFSILNIGSMDARMFTVYVYDGDPEDTGKEVYNVTIDFLGYYSSNNRMEINLTSWKPDRAGESEIFVVLNGDRLINETRYTNNMANITIIVLNSDVEIKTEDISLARSDGTLYDINRLNSGDDKITKGQTVNINAVVYNHGDAEVTVMVNFYSNHPDSSASELIGTENRVINAGDNQKVTHSWNNVNVESFRIYVEVDPEDDIIESNEENNLAGMEYGYDTSVSEEEEKTEEFDMFMLFSIILIIIIIIVIIVVIYFMVIVKKRKDTMAECSECGNLMPLDATICEKCGAEFTDEVECGECGAIMSVTDTVCPECGAEFKKALSEEEVKGGEKPPKAVTPVGKAGEGAPGAPSKPSAPAPPKVKKGPGEGEAPAAAPAAAPKVKAAADEEEMIECYQCGATVPLSAPMCPECGAEFE
jgi:RNA polymerase subunit RPABC4/transcription elongation factor Spt4